MAYYDANSRYSADPDRKTATRAPINYSQKQFSLYTVKAGDTLENIASRRLGSQRRYWEIADINPQIKFPIDLQPGTVLRIPL
jgi:nucleoid-associated protein YgaU